MILVPTPDAPASTNAVSSSLIFANENKSWYAVIHASGIAAAYIKLRFFGISII